MTATTTMLKRGSRGPEVVDLQYLLLFRGSASSSALGKPDGDFGPKTEGAVKQFQKIKGLQQDGIVGERTWGALADADEWPTHFVGKFLRQGDTGAEELQQGLQSKGFYKGAVDGIFGPKTHKAVVDLQTYGEPVTNTAGVVGPLTFGAAIGD
jgi:peptidoglycan hydrolase-like protein with peptidoglycan-binding domain